MIPLDPEAKPVIEAGLKTVKFEYHEEAGHSLTFGIHTEWKPILFILDIVIANLS